MASPAIESAVSNLCPVCLQGMQGDSPGVPVTHAMDGAIQVPHFFHDECIRPWAALHDTCPLDRRRITHIDGQPILQNVDAPGHLAIAQVPLANALMNGLDVMNAANNGDLAIVLAIVQALLANGPISEVDRGLAVAYAARGGHLAIVQELLANGPISEVFRGLAVVKAATGGHLAIVQALLANGLITEEDRDLAVVKATQSGHLAIVWTLRKKFLSVFWMAVAVGTAALVSAAAFRFFARDYS